MDIKELEILINSEIDGLVNGLRHPLTVKQNLMDMVKELYDVKLNLPVVGCSLPKIKEIVYSQKEIDYIERIADDYNMQEETVIEILKKGFRMYKKRIK